VAAWVKSGRSCKEYAATAGINARTLSWWKSKLRGSTPASFVEVTAQVAAAAPEAGVLELIVGRTTLRVRGRVDSDALARVLDVLEARA
jgi:hypothetical protein